MKILVNKTNGQVLIFKKVGREADLKAYYTLYDNGVYYAQGKFLEDTHLLIDKEASCPVPATYTEFMEYIGLQAVQNVFPDFVGDTDTLNWAITEGSTGLPTTLRVVIPSDLIGNELYSGSNLDQLLQAMSPLASKTTRGKIAVVQYLEELLPEHRSILVDYASNGVIIQEKPVTVYEVLFEVTQDSILVENANVEINGELGITNEYGIATFTLSNGSYPYTVTYPDATVITGTAIVTDNNLLLTISV